MISKTRLFGNVLYCNKIIVLIDVVLRHKKMSILVTVMYDLKLLQIVSQFLYSRFEFVRIFFANNLQIIVAHFNQVITLTVIHRDPFVFILIIL